VLHVYERKKERKKKENFKKKKNHTCGMGISRGTTKRFFRSISRDCLSKLHASVHEQTSGRGVKGKARVILCTLVAVHAILVLFDLSIASSRFFSQFAVRSSFLFSIFLARATAAAISKQERLYCPSVRSCFTP